MKNEFKVGDRVRYIGNAPNLFVGDTGTVCWVFDDDLVGVAWDIQHPSMHDCCGRCGSGYGWFVRRYEIEVFQPEPELERDYVTLNVLELFA